MTSAEGVCASSQRQPSLQPAALLDQPAAQHRRPGSVRWVGEAGLCSRAEPCSQRTSARTGSEDGRQRPDDVDESVAGKVGNEDPCQRNDRRASQLPRVHPLSTAFNSAPSHLRVHTRRSCVHTPRPARGTPRHSLIRLDAVAGPQLAGRSRPPPRPPPLRSTGRRRGSSPAQRTPSASPPQPPRRCPPHQSNTPHARASSRI
eukprot:3882035-Rhodomonas_salina.1